MVYKLNADLMTKEIYGEKEVPKAANVFYQTSSDEPPPPPAPKVIFVTTTHTITPKMTIKNPWTAPYEQLLMVEERDGYTDGRDVLPEWQRRRHAAIKCHGRESVTVFMPQLEQKLVDQPLVLERSESAKEQEAAQARTQKEHAIRQRKLAIQAYKDVQELKRQLLRATEKEKDEKEAAPAESTEAKEEAPRTPRSDGTPVPPRAASVRKPQWTALGTEEPLSKNWMNLPILRRRPKRLDAPGDPANPDNPDEAVPPEEEGEEAEEQFEEGEELYDEGEGDIPQPAEGSVEPSPRAASERDEGTAEPPEVSPDAVQSPRQPPPKLLRKSSNRSPKAAAPRRKRATSKAAVSQVQEGDEQYDEGDDSGTSRPVPMLSVPNMLDVALSAVSPHTPRALSQRELYEVTTAVPRRAATLPRAATVEEPPADKADVQPAVSKPTPTQLARAKRPDSAELTSADPVPVAAPPLQLPDSWRPKPVTTAPEEPLPLPITQSAPNSPPAARKRAMLFMAPRERRLARRHSFPSAVDGADPSTSGDEAERARDAWRDRQEELGILGPQVFSSRLFRPTRSQIRRHSLSGSSIPPHYHLDEDETPPVVNAFGLQFNAALFNPTAYLALQYFQPAAAGGGPSNSHHFNSFSPETRPAAGGTSTSRPATSTANGQQFFRPYVAQNRQQPGPPRIFQHFRPTTCPNALAAAFLPMAQLLAKGAHQSPADATTPARQGPARSPSPGLPPSSHPAAGFGSGLGGSLDSQTLPGGFGFSNQATNRLQRGFSDVLLPRPATHQPYASELLLLQDAGASHTVGRASSVGFLDLRQQPASPQAAPSGPPRRTLDFPPAQSAAAAPVTAPTGWATAPSSTPSRSAGMGYSVPHAVSLALDDDGGGDHVRVATATDGASLSRPPPRLGVSAGNGPSGFPCNSSTDTSSRQHDLYGMSRAAPSPLLTSPHRGGAAGGAGGGPHNHHDLDMPSHLYFREMPYSPTRSGTASGLPHMYSGDMSALPSRAGTAFGVHSMYVGQDSGTGGGSPPRSSTAAAVDTLSHHDDMPYSPSRTSTAFGTSRGATPLQPSRVDLSFGGFGTPTDRRSAAFWWMDQRNGSPTCHSRSSSPTLAAYAATAASAADGTPRLNDVVATPQPDKNSPSRTSTASPTRGERSPAVASEANDAQTSSSPPRQERFLNIGLATIGMCAPSGGPSPHGGDASTTATQPYRPHGLVATRGPLTPSIRENGGASSPNHPRRKSSTLNSSSAAHSDARTFSATPPAMLSALTVTQMRPVTVPLPVVPTPVTPPGAGFGAWDAGECTAPAGLDLSLLKAAAKPTSRVSTPAGGTRRAGGGTEGGTEGGATSSRGSTPGSGRRRAVGGTESSTSVSTAGLVPVPLRGGGTSGGAEAGHPVGHAGGTEAHPVTRGGGTSAGGTRRGGAGHGTADVSVPPVRKVSTATGQVRRPSAQDAAAKSAAVGTGGTADMAAPPAVSPLVSPSVPAVGAPSGTAEVAAGATAVSAAPPRMSLKERLGDLSGAVRLPRLTALPRQTDY